MSRSIDDKAPGYEVWVDDQQAQVYGAASCRAPSPFRIFKRGERDDIKLASADAPAGPAQIAPAGNAPYAFTCFPIDRPVTITVRAPMPLDRTQLRPAGIASEVELEGETLRFRLDQPAKLSIEPNGRHGGLLLFADPPERDIPDPDDPRVHYYGPGLHRAGVIRLRDGETLYLAPGAIVEGGVSVEHARDVRICGRGILCGDPWGWRDGPQKDMMIFTEAENVTVEGIVLRASWQWTFRMTGCRNLTIRNLKLCCGKNLNDDGIDPSSCTDVLIEGCFVRTYDDCISIKGHCADRRPCERIEIRNCLFWSDMSRVLMIGPESHCERMGDIHLHDCEVLRMGPPIKEFGFGDWDGAAPAFCLQAGEDCRMEQILIERVRLHLEANRDGKDLILLEPTVNQFMQRRTPGTLRDITFRDLTCTGEPCTPLIRIAGRDTEHTVERVTLERINLFGSPLAAGYPGLRIGDHTAAIAVPE